MTPRLFDKYKSPLNAIIINLLNVNPTPRELSGCRTVAYGCCSCNLSQRTCDKLQAEPNARPSSSIPMPTSLIHILRYLGVSPAIAKDDADKSPTIAPVLVPKLIAFASVSNKLPCRDMISSNTPVTYLQLLCRVAYPPPCRSLTIALMRCMLTMSSLLFRHLSNLLAG